MSAAGHAGLLSLARRAGVMALEGDVEALSRAARCFCAALDRHLGEEVGALVRVEPAEARMLERGRARLAAAAGRLLGEATAGCEGPPERCRSRAEELQALLRLQVHDEQLALHRAGPSGAALRAAGTDGTRCRS